MSAMIPSAHQPIVRDRGNVDPTWYRFLASLQGQLFDVTSFNTHGDGVNDDSAAFQGAITAVTATNGSGFLFVPPGNYLWNSQVNITSKLTIVGVPGQSNILLGTPGQNGLVIGDGTVNTRANCVNTLIYGLGFYPKPGVANFSTGSYIFRNYATSIQIQNCIFDGRDSGGPVRMWNGLTDFQVTESLVRDSIFIGFRNSGTVVTSGTPALLCTDNRYDFCEWQLCTGDALVLGTTTGGITIAKPIMFGNSGWNIKIDSAAGSNNNINFFIDTPDIEIAAGASGGIYAKQGSGVQITGGWVGAKAVATKVGLQVDSTAGRVQSTGVIYQSLINLSGTACHFGNCDLAGDNSSTVSGITVNAGATDFVYQGGSIIQFTGQGILYNSSPPAARCLVEGVSFRNNALNIAGDASASSNAPPICRGCYDDFTNFTLTAAATLPLRHGMDGFIAVTGATHITAMTAIGFGSRVTIFASGNVNIDNSASITLKGGANATISSGATMDLICDGANWRETARSF